MCSQYLGPGPVDLSKRKTGMGKKIFWKAFIAVYFWESAHSLKLLFVSRMWEQWRTQLGIRTAGHLPQTVTKLPKIILCCC